MHYILQWSMLVRPMFLEEKCYVYQKRKEIKYVYIYTAGGTRLG
jgi:hypothetical protein